MKKVILVTGASAGFGKLTVEKLINEGYIVYGAARRTEKMQDLKLKGAHILKMDVTDEASVENGVNKIISEQGQIDVLFNNAGFGMYGTIESISMDDIRYQYDVNVFGVARLIKAVLPHMRKKKSGLIINTASLVGHISMAALGWYASTKHAVEALSDALRQEVKHLGIKVVLIEPGAVKTDFDNVAFENLDKIEHQDEYKAIVNGFKKYSTDMYSKAPGPESTANAVLKAIKTKRPKFRYATTSDAKVLPTLRGLLGDKVFDNFILKQLNKWNKQ